MARPRLVEGVLDRLLHNLASGAWRSGSKMPSTRRLAGELDVALVTLQKAMRLAAKAKLLRLRLRHLAVVEPDAQARASQLLARRYSRSKAQRLAILIPENYFPLAKIPLYARLTAAVLREATKRHVATKVVPWRFSEQISAATNLVRQGFGAAMAIAFRPEHLISLHMLREQRFPIFAFNRHLSDMPLPAVRLDEYAAAQKLAAHLRALGHRNLCLVDNMAPIGGGYDGRGGRDAGWAHYLREHDLLDQCSMPLHITEQVASRSMYGRNFEQVLRAPDGPTALVFAHDFMADVYLRDPRFADLEVPARLSLATFDSNEDLPAVPWSPPLTFVAMDLLRTAECAIEIAEKLLAGDLDTPSIRVPMRINLTSSIGPPPDR